ncbi:16S rRNA (adenine(1518)-N(6)/adenine(1519)-N(6))-dimethyltransferase [Candidatus Uhrbacteria bacterium]|nr:16S rRNA (adenine(1518)-N(6)/adenine(1519)-N(6))-dimethyltransferase [Candidatus Uhrbacteria bacterium]
MNLLSPPVLKALCIRAGKKPERSLGQHFLIHAGTLAEIVTTVDPQPADTILEVGPGFGVLTTALAPRVGRLIAIEMDRQVIPVLQEIVAPFGWVEIVAGDALRVLSGRERGSLWPLESVHGGIAPEGGDVAPPLRLATYPSDVVAALHGRLGSPSSQHSWKLAANLPYQITSDFLRVLFDQIAAGAIPPPERIVLLLQKEVVDRLVGADGSVGFLTVLTQLHATARRVVRVPASHFWPPPKVEGAVVQFTEIRSPEALADLLQPLSRDQFLRFVHMAFAGRRKQIGTSIRTIAACDRSEADAICVGVGIDPTARPETLTLAQWIALAKAVGR